LAELQQKGSQQQVSLTGDSQWICATHWAIGKEYEHHEHCERCGCNQALRQ
jgi:hypothetical protein